ncbi:putative RNA methyltransferase [Psychrobacillus sp. OK032]|uniref:putative RNA methyltransferase n=1 Tax=Psychrobacillus sp. OK032 TaxID=1884358 RepID=UPI000B856DE5|nr:methyltransferase domain-containing protein [Psychrobacillus sp. OK032]
MTNRIKSAQYVSGLESIFKCPICDSPMSVYELQSLVCANNHTYDFSKQGYINMLSHPIKTKYGNDLFEARRKLIAEGHFFEPLSSAIAQVIKEQKNPAFILDTGCGEGSHLSHICDTVSADLEKPVHGIGIDISKEGILAAAKNYTDKVWLVADLAKMPFKEEQFDIILNILSPSNYAEFNRLLNDDGLIIKVVPQSDYLKELREIVYDKPEKQAYSNADTVDLFKENFQVVNTSRIRYTKSLDNPLIHALVRMTPLTWAASEEKLKGFLDRESADITVDLEILIGRKTI